jgi:hypothetical protein
MPTRTRSTPLVKIDRPDFGTSAADTLRSLRTATASLLTGLGGVDRAVDVANRLGLDRSLAWKIWQVAQGPGPLPAPAHIPGQQGFALFLSAAARAGADKVALERAREAFEAFGAFTQIHAGDRATVDSMLGALTDQGRSRLELSLRRDGFRSNAHFLGLSASAVYQADFLIPTGSEWMPDIVRVRGHFGLQWIRPNVTWVVARSTLVHADGPTSDLQRRPLVPDPVSGSTLLPEFSSTPTPNVHRRVIGGVTVEDELVRDRVGATGAIDVVTGERISHMPRRDVPTDAVTLAVMTPCERLVYDVIAPSTFLPTTPALRVHSTVQTELPYLRGENFNTIPVFEEFQDMGPVGPDASGSWPVAAEVPRHDRLLEWLGRQLGPSLRGCRLWRLRMKYPPVPSCLAAEYQLPPGP